MRTPVLLVSLGLVAAATAPVSAQSSSHGWRFGAELSAPARVLSDGSNHINLGIGEAVEAERLLGGRGANRATLLLRVATAPVNGTGDSNDWTPGHAFIADLALRAEHTAERTDLFVGAGLSHWSGPGAVSPFAGASSVLLAAEAGIAVRAGNSPWRFSLTAQGTKFGPNDNRHVLSGSVLRFLVGVQRDY